MTANHATRTRVSGPPRQYTRADKLMKCARLRVLLNAATMSDSPLKTLDVVKALKKLSLNETRHLVFHLGVSLASLDDIVSEYHEDTRKAKFVDKWLDIDPGASWEKLASALQEIDKKTLAVEILNSYGSSYPTHRKSLLVTRGSAQLKETPCSVVAIATSVPPATVSKERVAEVEEIIEYFQEEFSEIKSEALMSLTEKEENNPKFLASFCDRLLDLPVSKKAIHVKFFYRNEDEILQAKNIRKVFRILGRYCNYSNYEIIFHIVKRFCGKPLQLRMLTYQTTHTEFEKETTVEVFLLASSASPGTMTEFTKMVMKINKSTNECSLYEVRQLKESITKESDLQEYTVYIEGPELGSVNVVLSFPPQCKQLVAMALTPSLREIHKVTDVTIDGQDLREYLVSCL